MAPHSSTFAWKIPWMEEPGRLQSVGPLESDTTERLHFPFSLSCIGEGNGNPLSIAAWRIPWTEELGRLQYGNNNPVYETAIETLMYRTVLWTL